MKNRVWISLMICILLGSCASSRTYYHSRENRMEARMKMNYQRQDRENYRQNKRMQKRINRKNKGRRYDTNVLGNVIDR
ncbi:MAG: hypothetical protein J0H46_03910 [Bacteroidetes bacterium]|nr:hypothetical protein [Bacteroidota bacterium]